MKKLSMAVAAAVVAGLMFAGAGSAEARSSWSVGFSTGGWYGGPAYYPYPAYPAYVAPVVVAPRPCYRPYYRPVYGGYPGSFSFSYHHR